MNILQSAASLPVIDHRWTHLHADRCTRLLSIDETRFVCGWPRPQRSGEKKCDTRPCAARLTVLLSFWNTRSKASRYVFDLASGRVPMFMRIFSLDGSRETKICFTFWVIRSFVGLDGFVMVFFLSFFFARVLYCRKVSSNAQTFVFLLWVNKLRAQV